MSALMPTEPGFYWAKWKIAEEGTLDGDESVNPNKWEAVEVWENCIDHSFPEWLKVSVAGVEQCQPVENFFWGEKLHPIESPVS